MSERSPDSESSQQLLLSGFDLDNAKEKMSRFSEIMDNPQRVLMAIYILCLVQNNPTDLTIEKIVAEAKEQRREYDGDLYFKEEDGKVYKRFDYVKMLKTINVLRRELRRTLGQSWDDFVEEKSGAECMAFVTTEEETNLRDSIYDKLDFLSSYKTVEKKNSRIRALGTEANKYITKLVQDCVGGYDDFTGYNKVIGANDLVKLLYLAATDDDLKIRYEAVRKFLLIIVLGRQHEQTDEKDGADNQNALSEMEDFLQDAFYPERGGGKATAKRFLCFQVGRFLRERKVMHARICDRKQKGVQSLDFPMRPAMVTDEEGESRIIRYHSEIRFKDIEKRSTKRFRDGKNIDEKGPDDQNGLRLVFENEKDLRDFNRNTQKRLVAHLKKRAEAIKSDLQIRIETYEEGSTPSKSELEKRLENIEERLNTIEDSFEIIELKDGLDGGMDPTSKAGKKIRVYKIKVRIKGIAEIPEKEKEFVFEIQSFLAGGYVEAMYQDTPGMHNVKRVYESADFPGDMPIDLPYGLADLMWPTWVWSEANKESLRADSMETAYRKDIAKLEQMGFISYARGTIAGAVADLRRKAAKLDEEAEQLSRSEGVGKMSGLVQVSHKKALRWAERGRQRASNLLKRLKRRKLDKAS